MRIKSILVSQPKPETEKNPYYDLANKYNLRIDFRPFNEIEGISSKEFRLSKINVNDFSAIIFTSKASINHFFKICEELRVKVSEDIKYFCNSESTAWFLQKFIVYRKRKVFYGNGNILDLNNILKHHTSETYLVPCSESHKDEVNNGFDKININYKRAITYRTVNSDLSDIEDLNYNVLVFFNPAGIKSLFYNFPNYVQNETKIAAFGASTAKAVIEAGLSIDIQAPMPEAPSMTMALELFIKKNNGK